VAEGGLTVNRTDAGHVDFVAPLGDHPYEEGLVGKPSQTYYEVMLGYPSREQSPNYGVLRTAWEEAGGTSVATVGEQSGGSPNTALGHLDRGKGRLTIFGAILPQAIESLPDVETPHPHGLASYAVTITGGQVLDNVLAYRGAGRTSPAPAPAPACPPRRSVRPASGCRPPAWWYSCRWVRPWPSVRRRSSGVARDADLEALRPQAVRQRRAHRGRRRQHAGRLRQPVPVEARHSALSPCMTAVAA
jgi:hypothetical protein